MLHRNKNPPFSPKTVHPTQCIVVCVCVCTMCVCVCVGTTLVGHYLITESAIYHLLFPASGVGNALSPLFSNSWWAVASHASAFSQECNTAATGHGFIPLPVQSLYWDTQTHTQTSSLGHVLVAGRKLGAFTIMSGVHLHTTKEM